MRSLCMSREHTYSRKTFDLWIFRLRCTVETLYSMILNNTKFYITRWTHGTKIYKGLFGPESCHYFFNKTNLRVTCLFTACAIRSEWFHMWPAASVNNDSRTNYLRLSHFTALSAGVNNHLGCIHKGLTAWLSRKLLCQFECMIKQF